MFCQAKIKSNPKNIAFSTPVDKSVDLPKGFEENKIISSSAGKDFFAEQTRL